METLQERHADQSLPETQTNNDEPTDKISCCLKFSFRITVLLLYCSFVVYAAVVNFHKALPLIYFTSFLLFCFIWYITRKRYGNQIVDGLSRLKKSMECLQNKRLCIALYVVVILSCVCFVVITNLHTLDNLISLAGLLTFVGFSWVISFDRKKIKWRSVVWGIALQLVLGLLILRTETGRSTFTFLGKQVENFQSHVIAGVEFVFGEKYTDFEFVFKLMPTVIFINSVVSILYHVGLMQMLVEKFAVIMHVTMGTTAAETMCTAASMFLGQPEASFTIRPYLTVMTRSELFAIMTAGFASVSADIFGLFVKYGISSSHILTAVLMSAPAGLAVSKIICPETEESKTKTWKQIQSINSGSEYSNVIDAAAKGAKDAMMVVLTVVACLIAFLSILSFLNAVIAYLGDLVELQDLSMNVILGYVMIPVVYIMGVPWVDCRVVGEVIGLKTVVNEFVGYTKLGEFIKIQALSTKSQVIATYALCGFSNPMTMGVIVGALGVLVPDRKLMISRIVVRAWIAGCIACFMTACTAGILYEDTDMMPIANLTITQNNSLYDNTYIIDRPV